MKARYAKPTPNQKGIYSKVAEHSDEILDVFFEGLKSRNENIRFGAAKALLNKLLPDLRASEITGKDGEPFTVNIIRDYLSKSGVDAPPASSAEGSDEVQDTGVAQEGEKDLDSA
ncbi:MAG: hypothetical protein PHV11_05535 [Candidatus Bipolaricaulis sp.]|jgi:hypothetical protein|nr:hypothetical protein [Candidatus Bipolaricaulis sp.]